MVIIDIIQKSAVLLKEAAEMVLFSFMTHHSWFEFFDTSVLPNIILPIIAVTIAIGAAIQWVKCKRQLIRILPMRYFFHYADLVFN